uniref:Hexosyltransferase n=1 Tax=Romanomermis culicivorax TaxID=13658 RepID=A0A915KHU3_ROMCU
MELHYVALRSAQDTYFCNQTGLHYMVEPRKCDSYMVIFVKCTVDDFISRNAIRKTWKMEAQKFNMRVIFVVGSTPKNTSIALESLKFDDILQADFIESYRHLSLKTYAALYWYDKNCRKESVDSYVMLIDTDVLFFPNNLDLYLKNEENFRVKNTIMGNCHDHLSGVWRDNSSKWFMSYDAWPLKSYPPHCQGNGYLMTDDCPRKLLSTIPGGISNWRWAQKMDHLEDVTFTGLLAALAQIEKKNVDTMLLFNDTINSKLCNGLITAHSFKPPEEYTSFWFKYWKLLERC